MKVLIVNTVRFRTNGITSVIMNYYRNMDRTGMQVDFVVINEVSDHFRKELESQGSRIYQLPRSGNPLSYMWQLYRLARKNRYDVVHVHGNSALMSIDLLPVALARVPVRIAHSHNTACEHMKAHKLLFPLFSHLYTHGFACGDAAGKWAFHDKPFVVLKNGINLDDYRYSSEARERTRAELGAGDRVVIGHVGNYNPEKNHEFMLEWFADLIQKDDRYMLVLAGYGDLMEQAREKAKALNLGDRVRFLGKTARVSDYLQAMDLFVLPSTHEGLPVVLVEAQAAGLPCFVSSAVSREADLSGELRFLPVDRRETWVDTLASEIDPLLKQDRAERCRRWQEKIAQAGYDITENANTMRSLYQTCLEEKTGRR